MLKIYAKCLGGNWQTAVGYGNGTVSYFDRVVIDGRCTVETQQDAHPHVYIIPDASAKVTAHNGDKTYQLQ